MIPGTTSGRLTFLLDTLRMLAIPAALVMALSLGYAAPSDAQEPLARTSEITDAKEQLSFGVKMARRGLWSEALFRFKQARRLDPSNPRVLNNMAVAYEALGHFDKALETYQEAVRLQSSDRDLRKNYSRFVEFYRAFRPDDQKDASLEESGAATAANDNSANDNSANDNSAEDSAVEGSTAPGNAASDGSSGSDA